MQVAHAAHMRLVDDGRVCGVRGAPFIAPIEVRIGHDAEGRESRAVAVVEGQVAVRVAHLIAE